MLTINEIKVKSLPVLREAGVIRSSLFGSYVRGDHRTDGDIDILVELPKGVSLFDIAELKYKLEDALEKRVDLVQYHIIKPELRDSILSRQEPII